VYLDINLSNALLMYCILALLMLLVDNDENEFFFFTVVLLWLSMHLIMSFWWLF